MPFLKNLFPFLLLLSIQCKTGPVVKPKTQGSNSVLVLVAEINKPFDFNVYSRKTYLVKLAENQYIQKKVIESDYSAGFSETRNYFFNLEPGKYTVIAVNYTARGGNGMFKPYTVLDEKSIQGLIFEITEGEVKVFGHLKMKESSLMNPDISEGDSLQKHYAGIFKKDSLKENSGFYPIRFANFENLDNSEDRKNEIKSSMISDLKNSDWYPIVNK